jgi:uncharacterized protein (TIGR04222 family)
MFPFDLRGPQFLAFYVLLLLGGFLAACVVRRKMRQPEDEGSPPDRDLDPYALAYLAGGGKRAADTVIAHLVERGDLVYESTAQFLHKNTQAAAHGSLHPFESILYDSLPDEGRSLRSVHQQAWLTANELFTKELRERELLIPSSRSNQFVMLAFLVLGLVLAVGLAKFSIGVQSQRPVGYLMLLLFAGTMGTIFFLKSMRKVTRTLRGEHVLEALRRQNAALFTTAQSQDKTWFPEKESLTLMGLFGLTALSLPLIPELQTSLLTLAQSQAAAGFFGGPHWWGGGGGWGGSGDNGSSGSGDGGGGWGGGGCGGCGGGGCGGGGGS